MKILPNDRLDELAEQYAGGGNFYTRLKEKKCHQKAIVAAARKLLVSIFHMLKRNEPYDPPGVSS